LVKAFALGADDAVLAIHVELPFQRRFCENATWVGHTTGRGLEEFMNTLLGLRHDVPARNRLGHAGAVHGRHLGVQQAAASELTQDAHDAARTMHVLDVHIGAAGATLHKQGTLRD
jgi:hypothetical protein